MPETMIHNISYLPCCKNLALAAATPPDCGNCDDSCCGGVTLPPDDGNVSDDEEVFAGAMNWDLALVRLLAEDDET